MESIIPWFTWLKCIPTDPPGYSGGVVLMPLKKLFLIWKKTSIFGSIPPILIKRLVVLVIFRPSMTYGFSGLPSPGKPRVTKSKLVLITMGSCGIYWGNKLVADVGRMWCDLMSRDWWGRSLGSEPLGEAWFHPQWFKKIMTFNTIRSDITRWILLFFKSFSS